MSKWICVDDVIVEIGGGYIDIDAESFMTAPSIDIVRCGECTERDDDWCMYFGKMINPDDFCSYGERRE